MAKVSLNLDDEVLQRATADAEAAGLSVSAYVSRTLRADQLRRARQKYDEWVAANPDVREEITAWRAMTQRDTAQRWATLAGGEA